MTPKDLCNDTPKGWNFILELPRRQDFEATTEKTWDVTLPDGLVFEGQRFSLPDGLSVNAEARWVEDSLLSVKISLASRLVGECARCLAVSELAISDDLMYLYFSRGLDFEDTELGSDDGFMPVEVDFFGRTLSIAGQVWESLVVLLPARMLCRLDCAGLCPICGADLNEGACSCVPNGDPRLNVLREFLTPEGGKE
ncbi:metal-binding protein [Synergistales bacterium]|nr:metal-binding protein [Synergistales bacterium]